MEELKLEPDDEKLRKYKSNWQRHVTSMNSNRLPKNNTEIKTEWTKTHWNTFEETIIRAENRSIKVYLVADDDDDND